MRFGFYSPYLDTFGGGERYMLTLASHLSKNHMVDIFWDDPMIKAPLSRFLKIDLAQTKFTKNIFKRSLFEKCFLTLGYNLIFVLSDGSIPTTLASKNILHFQVPFQFKSRSFRTKLTLLRYKCIIANSYFTKKYIDQSFNISSQVIYPPVDIKSITPAKKEKIILSVGRFSKEQLHPKNQEVLIEVFKELYRDVSDWKLILVGQAKKQDQKYIRSLKKIVRGHAIRILENVPFEKLRHLYAQSSIYWHATGFSEDETKYPEKMEHFGIATVEASAAGAVPVVIDKGGQKEILVDNKNGRLWSTKTQLYEKTLELIKNKEKMLTLSQSAIKNSQRFSQEVFLRQYEKIIF